MRRRHGEQRDVFSATIRGIVRIPRGGGDAVMLEPDSSPIVFAGDATSLYFFGSHDVGAPDPQGKVSSGNALYSIPREGGTRTLLLDGAYGNYGSCDGTTLTWVSATGLT